MSQKKITDGIRLKNCKGPWKENAHLFSNCSRQNGSVHMHRFRNDSRRRCLACRGGLNDGRGGPDGCHMRPLLLLLLLLLLEEGLLMISPRRGVPRRRARQRHGLGGGVLSQEVPMRPLPQEVTVLWSSVH